MPGVPANETLPFEGCRAHAISSTAGSTSFNPTKMDAVDILPHPPQQISHNITFTGCLLCVNLYHGNMSGMATFAGASVDHMTGPIAMPMVATLGVILLSHLIFDVNLANMAPVSASLQRGNASTTANRPATNHTLLAYSSLLFTHGDHRDPDLSAEPRRLSTTAINRAIANHQSGSNSIGDTANSVVRGCR